LHCCAGLRKNLLLLARAPAHGGAPRGVGRRSVVTHAPRPCQQCLRQQFCVLELHCAAHRAQCRHSCARCAQTRGKLVRMHAATRPWASPVPLPECNTQPPTPRASHTVALHKATLDCLKQCKRYQLSDFDRDYWFQLTSQEILVDLTAFLHSAFWGSRVAGVGLCCAGERHALRSWRRFHEHGVLAAAVAEGWGPSHMPHARTITAVRE
jgi:hypothetical protein